MRKRVHVSWQQLKSVPTVPPDRHSQLWCFLHLLTETHPSIAITPSDPSILFAAFLICLQSNTPSTIIGRDVVCQVTGVAHACLFTS